MSAHNLTMIRDTFQLEEIIEVGFHTNTAVKKMIESGEIDDGMTLVALQRYLMRCDLHNSK